MKVTAVITAGGSGTRFKADKPKQFLPLAGLPMIVRTVQAFEKCPQVDRIVVTVPKDQVSFYAPGTFHQYDLRKVKATIAGGKTRQESVHLGLRAIDWPCDAVAIHDAARPLITFESINRTIDALEGWDGAVLAVPVKDTIKQVKKDSLIEKTIPRKNLWAMQTPQVFRYPFILQAYDAAEKNHFEATDDAQVAEKKGGRVRVVEGSAMNIKITYNHDFRLAEAILKEERR